LNLTNASADRLLYNTKTAVQIIRCTAVMFKDI